MQPAAAAQQRKAYPLVEERKIELLQPPSTSSPLQTGGVAM